MNERSRSWLLGEASGVDVYTWSEPEPSGTENVQELEGACETPMLRNVTLTAPYMHTGEVETLEDVIELYDQGGEPAGNYAGAVLVTINRMTQRPVGAGAGCEGGAGTGFPGSVACTPGGSPVYPVTT